MGLKQFADIAEGDTKVQSCNAKLGPKLYLDPIGFTIDDRLTLLTIWQHKVRDESYPEMILLSQN